MAEPDAKGNCSAHPERAAIVCPECVGEDYPHRSERLRIWEIAKSLVGIRYQWGGRGRGSMDCAGPVAQVALEMGWPGYSFRDYSPGFGGQPMQDAIDHHMVRVNRIESLLPGDVVLILIRRVPNHLLILGPKGDAIHCLKKSGVARLILTGRWRQNAHQGYRYRELCHVGC